MSLSRTTYNSLPLTAVKGTRETITIRPTTEQQVYKGGDTIRFDISHGDFQDPQNFHLQGRFKVFAPGAVQGDVERGGVCLPQSLESIFDYIIVRVGGRVIDDIRNYGQFESIWHTAAQSTDSVNSLGHILTGQTLKDKDRIIHFTAVAGVLEDHPMQDVYYSVDLSGLSLYGSSPDYIPQRYIGGRQPVSIEIHLKKAKDSLTLFRAVENDTLANQPAQPTSVYYELSDVHVMCDTLEMDAVSLAYDSSILERPLVYPVTTVNNYTVQLPHDVLRFQHTWSHTGSDVRMIIATFTNNGIADLAKDYAPICTSDMCHFPPFLTEARLQIGSVTYPRTDNMKFIWKGSNTRSLNMASNGVMAMREWVKAMGRSADTRSGFLLTPNLYSQNKYPSKTTDKQSTDPANITTLGFDESAGDDYRTSFCIAWNTDSNPSESTVEVAGTGANLSGPNTHSLTMSLYFDQTRGVYNRDTNPMGGAYTCNIYVLTKNNLIIYADRVELETNLLIPASGGAM